MHNEPRKMITEWRKSTADRIPKICTAASSKFLRSELDLADTASKVHLSDPDPVSDWRILSVDGILHRLPVKGHE